MDLKKLAQRIREAKPYRDPYETGIVETQIGYSVDEVYDTLANVIEELIEEGQK